MRRFLGAYAFYHIWIPHYAHLAEALYGLLKKGQKFKWEKEHTKAMKRLKGMLVTAPALQKAVYKEYESCQNNVPNNYSIRYMINLMLKRRA